MEYQLLVLSEVIIHAILAMELFVTPISAVELVIHVNHLCLTHVIVIFLKVVEQDLQVQQDLKAQLLGLVVIQDLKAQLLGLLVIQDQEVTQDQQVIQDLKAPLQVQQDLKAQLPDLQVLQVQLVQQDLKAR
jgi:hypothetical protein